MRWRKARGCFCSTCSAMTITRRGFLKFLQSLGFVAAAPLAPGASMGSAAGADAPVTPAAAPATIKEFVIMANAMFSNVEILRPPAYEDRNVSLFGFGKIVERGKYVEQVAAGTRYEYIPTRGGKGESASAAIVNAWASFSSLAADKKNDVLVWRALPKLESNRDFESNTIQWRVYLRAYVKIGAS